MDLAHLLARLLLAAFFAVTGLADLAGSRGAVNAFGVPERLAAPLGTLLPIADRPDCHCFGQLHSEPAGWRTPARNGLSAAVAAFVVVRGPADPGASTVAWPGDLSMAGMFLHTCGPPSIPVDEATRDSPSFPADEATRGVGEPLAGSRGDGGPGRRRTTHVVRSRHPVR